MNDNTKFKNNLILFEYSLINELSKNFNLLLNEFQIIKLFSSSAKNKREINFDTKQNDNIYQLKTNFDDEKTYLVKNFNEDIGYLGYLTKYIVINRDNINNIIEKRMSLMLKAKLTDLVDDSFINNKINQLIDVINKTIDNCILDQKITLINNIDINKTTKTNKNTQFNFVINILNNKKIKIDFQHKNNLFEFIELTRYHDNFFIDIDMNLNNILIFIFNKETNEEVIQYPLTEKERKHLLSKKGRNAL